MLKIYNTYIHIPFCERKCNYCDFISFKNSNSKKSEYVEYLLKEIELYKKKYDLSEKQRTIYFGGGTPSLLTIKELEKIISNFSYDENTEITLEVNPKTINKEKLLNYKKIGVNRLSIGIQTFNDKFLKVLGRIHTSKEAIETYNIAREIGYNNISLDLMFSLPNQKLLDLREDLEKLFSLNPEHFSIYSLIWEEGTNFYKQLLEGKLKETENEVEAKMYEFIIKEAQNKGYEHYEISNFSKKNYGSKHNINYWENNNYLGLGLSSSGYLKNIRYKNYINFEEYYTSIEKKILPIQEKEILTEEEIEQYKYLLGFRMMNKKMFSNDKNIKKFEKLLSENYIKKYENGYVITQKGLMFFNDFISEFI